MPFVAGYGSEDFAGGFTHPYDTPRLVERLNEDWYGLAVSSGLFDHRREFLVQLPHGTHTHPAALRNQGRGRHVRMAWTRVRLLDGWEIMGRGSSSAFLGIHAGRPGLAMMALDSSQFIGASTGEVGVDVIAVARPGPLGEHTAVSGTARALGVLLRRPQRAEADRRPARGSGIGGLTAVLSDLTADARCRPLPPIVTPGQRTDCARFNRHMTGGTTPHAGRRTRCASRCCASRSRCPWGTRSRRRRAG